MRAAIIETGYEYLYVAERTDEAEGRLENLQELVNAAVDYDDLGIEGLREFIDHSALVSDQDEYKRDAAVTLMTVHSAKGPRVSARSLAARECGNKPSSSPTTNTTGNSSPFAACTVISVTAASRLYSS